MKFILNSEFDTISYFAAVFSVIGAFFLVRSILKSGAKEIAAVSGTYIGSNPHLESALVNQKADSLIGFIFTFLGGILWWVTVFCAVMVELSSLYFVSFLLITILLAFLCHRLSKKIFTSLYEQTRVISFCNHVQGYLQDDGVRFDAQKLILDAKRLGIANLVKDEVDHFDNLADILRRGGAISEANFVMEIKKKKPLG